MMKTKLKFLLVFLGLMVGGVNGAWAQGADETYDFTSLSGGFTFGSSYSRISNGNYWEKIGETPIYGRFASCSTANRGWFFNSNKLRCWGGRYNPELAICHLHKGDKVIVTFTGSLKFVSGSAKIGNTILTNNNNLESGQEIVAVDNGDIIVKGDGEGTQGYTPIDFTFISQIEIYYSGSQTYTFTGNTGESVQPTAANSDIQPGASNYEPITINGESGFVLDFTDKYYGNSYFNHPDNRFFIKEGGWKVNQFGLQMITEENGTYYAFYILNLNIGDQVIVNLANPSNVSEDLALFWSTNTGNPSLTALSSGSTYVMQEDGILKLLVRKTAAVTSVVITPSQIRFSKMSDTYDLVNLGYDEPSLLGVPSGTSVSYSTGDPTIALINSDASATPGDLLVINTGTVRITATANINGIVQRAYYDLTVIAAEAFWDIRNGNECYFPGSSDPASRENTGKLLVRRVTSVPHMTMEFGDVSNSDLTMVTFRHNVRSANLIDANGWQQVGVNYTIDNGHWMIEPTQGTFYKFQPSISGKLTIKGVRKNIESDTGSGGANTVVLVDASATSTYGVSQDTYTDPIWADDVTYGNRTRFYADASLVSSDSYIGNYYSYPIRKTLNFVTNSYAVTEEKIDLVGGHTYYLYANTPRTRDTGDGHENWQNFYLSGFIYETDFHFTYQNVVLDDTSLELGENPVQNPSYHHVPQNLSSYQSYQQTISGSGITYDFVCKGDISATMENKTDGSQSNIGELTNITGHGAIVVTATLTEGSGSSSTSYVLTVPYTNCPAIRGGGMKSWIFNTTGAMEEVTTLRSNAPAKEWSIQYKVRRYDTDETKALNYINVPVLASALDVRGDNARYISTTAGLLFNADANSFGTNTSVSHPLYKSESVEDGIGRVWKKVDGVWVEQTSSADIDIALKTLLNLNSTDAVDPCNNVTMENGTSMTIPSLKAGQYVRIKWSRYARNQGDKVSVNNLNDLSGDEVSDPITIGAGGNVDWTGGTGYHEFRVKANGDVTFTLSENGWANIYRIDVANEFIPTDLRLMEPTSWGTYDDGSPKELTWSETPTTFSRKKGTGAAVSQTYSTQFGGTYSQSNTAVTYSIKSGSLTGMLTTSNCSVSDGKTMNISTSSTGGHGRFKLVQEGRVQSTNNSNTYYLLDKNEYEIKVYEYDYNQKSYPYTWNMKHVTEDTGNHTVTNLTTDSEQADNTTSHNYTYWNANDGDTKTEFTLRIGNPENLMAWNYKTTNNGTAVPIPELDGLGIIPQDLTSSEDNSVTFKAGNGGQGLQIGARNNTIVVPSVASGQTVYVAATGSGTVTISGAESSLTPTRELSSGVKVYEIAGSGSDVNLVFNNMTINQIAVSKDTKTVTAAGYATEARDYPLDFTLASTFGVNNNVSGATQTAYIIIGVDGANVTKEAVNYVPTGEGVMMGSGVTTDSYWPLFTTDVDQPTAHRSDNLLQGVTSTGVVVGQTTGSGSDLKYNYILSNGGYNVTMVNGTPTAGTTVSGLGYYLLFKDGTIVGGSTYSDQELYPNSAYLQLPSALAVHQGLEGSSARAVFFIDFDDDATDIQLPIAGITEMENDVYYTIQGVRTDQPGKGLYIRNGKKVFVK